MDIYSNREKDSLKGVLMVGFMGTSAFIGLIPVGYVVVWFLKHYL